MSTQKEREMEDIWQSWEWRIRERLEQLDRLSRKMYSEMGIFGVPYAVSGPYVQRKMRELCTEVIEKGDEEAIQEHNKLIRMRKNAVNTHSNFATM